MRLQNKNRKRQTTTAVCTYTPAEWEFNSDGDTPCQMYAELGAVCNPGFSVEPLTPANAPYPPPSGDNDTPCLCNLVAYSLMAACGWCQDEIVPQHWATVAEWRGNCTETTFTNEIPSTIDVSAINIPLYASDIPNGATWSPSEAEAIASASSSPTASATTGRPISTSNTSTNTRPIPSGGFGPNVNLDSLEKGASVVGIVIGVLIGIYALTYVIVGVVYWMRQKKRKAWYGAVAQHYQRGGQPPWAPGSAAAPLMAGVDPNLQAYPPQAGYPQPGQYQPYPPQQYGAPPQQNPFATPYGAPAQSLASSYSPAPTTVATSDGFHTTAQYNPTPGPTPGPYGGYTTPTPPPPQGTPYQSGPVPPMPQQGGGAYRGAAEVY